MYIEISAPDTQNFKIGEENSLFFATKRHKFSTSSASRAGPAVDDHGEDDDDDDKVVVKFDT